MFVSNTVPGDRIQVRLVQVKPRYAHGKLQQILSTSPHRIRPSCIVADKCPVQDPRLNPLLADVKQDIQHRGWQVYDEQHHRGQVRHLSLRIGRRTGEILLTLVVRERNPPEIEAQAQELCHRYPNLVGVSLS